MDDHELDLLLAKAAQPPRTDPRVSLATRDLIEQARTEGKSYDSAWLRKSTRRATQTSKRRRMVAGGAFAAGALLLTAGTTIGAYYLQIPPFQELPHGSVRTSEPIPLSYVQHDGSEIQCSIYLEFERTDQSTVDRLDTAIAERDWSSFGQELYDSNPDIPDLPPDNLGPGAIMDAAVPAVVDFADDVVTDLATFGSGKPDGPLLGAVATTCRPDAQ